MQPSKTGSTLAQTSSALNRSGGSSLTKRELEVETRLQNQHNQYCTFSYTPEGRPASSATRHTHFFADGDVVEREVAKYLLPANHVQMFKITAIEDRSRGVMLQIDDRMDVMQLRNKTKYHCTMRDIREDALMRLGIPSDMPINASNLRGLSNSQIDEIVDRFERIDEDQTGLIDVRELEELYANDVVAHERDHGEDHKFAAPNMQVFEQKRRERSRKALAKLFLSQYDMDGDGEINLREFLLAQAHAIELHERLVKRLAKGRRVALNERTVQLARLKGRRRQAEYTRQLKAYRERNPTMRGKDGKRKHPTSGAEGVLHDTNFLNGKNMTQEFKMIDTNSSGFITELELATLMERLGESRPLSRVHAKAFFQLADTDRDGRVSFEEFLASYSRMQMFKTVRLLKEQFEDFDINNDFELSKTEVYTALSEFYGHTQARHILDDVFDKLDSNGDGAVDLQELEYWTFTRASEVEMERQQALRETELRKLRGE